MTSPNTCPRCNNHCPEDRQCPTCAGHWPEQLHEQIASAERTIGELENRVSDLEVLFEVENEARGLAEKDRDKLKRVVDDQQTEIERTTHKLEKYRALQQELGEAWLWLNEEDNDLDSMSDGMAVQITAGDLKALITQQAVIDCRVEEGELRDADLAWAVVHTVCEINEATVAERDQERECVLRLSKYLTLNTINEMREDQGLPTLGPPGREFVYSVQEEMAKHVGEPETLEESLKRVTYGDRRNLMLYPRLDVHDDVPEMHAALAAGMEAGKKPADVTITHKFLKPEAIRLDPELEELQLSGIKPILEKVLGELPNADLDIPGTPPPPLEEMKGTPLTFEAVEEWRVNLERAMLENGTPMRVDQLEHLAKNLSERLMSGTVSSEQAEQEWMRIADQAVALRMSDDQLREMREKECGACDQVMPPEEPECLCDQMDGGETCRPCLERMAAAQLDELEGRRVGVDFDGDGSAVFSLQMIDSAIDPSVPEGHVRLDGVDYPVGDDGYIQVKPSEPIQFVQKIVHIARRECTCHDNTTGCCKQHPRKDDTTGSKP